MSPDPVAAEISKRQRYDWREKADLPINDLKVRQSIRELAESIASAIMRENTRITNDPAAEMRRNAEFVNVTETVARREVRKNRSRHKIVLWVDDRPNNNIRERKAFGEYNIDFVLAKSTEEAIEKLSGQSFDAIISDMGRPPDPMAGYTLLDIVRKSGSRLPFFIYAGSRAPEHVEEARRRGAQGTTNMPSELIAMVVREIGSFPSSVSAPPGR